MNSAISKCYACSNRNGNKIIIANEKMFGMPGEFYYIECGSCGHLMINEEPPNLASYYPLNYYSYQAEGSLKSFLKRKRAAAAFNEGSLLGWLLVLRYGYPLMKKLFTILDVRKTDRILDLGCGNGKNILELAEAGFEFITGADPFIAHPIVFRQIRILKSYIQELKGPFDIIMMNHSFEHMPDPLLVLQAIKNKLAPRGKLLIRVPCIGHGFRTFRENWVGLDAPRHLFIPTVESLTLMGEQAGLTLQHLYFDGDAFSFWGSEQYKRNILLNSPQSYSINPKKSIFSSADIARFEVEAKRLNECGDGDSAGFVFTHADDKTLY